MKKLLLITVVFICLIQLVNGYTAGELYTVTNITKCYGDLQIKVRGSDDIQDGEYDIVGCQKENDLWTCDCESVNSVNILTKDDTNNVYDITIEYYVAPITGDNTSVVTDEDNKRTKQFTNIGFKSLKKKESLKIPEFTGGFVILGIIGGVIIFIILIVILSLKFVFKGEDDIPDREMDKEVGNYIRKYTR